MSFHEVALSILALFLLSALLHLCGLPVLLCLNTPKRRQAANSRVRPCIYVVLCLCAVADKVYECNMLFKQYIEALPPPDRLDLGRKNPSISECV